MEQIADWISLAVANANNPEVLTRIRQEVRATCERFPLYPHLGQD
jgi:glycine/serine hydroxymethyltransferase